MNLTPAQGSEGHYDLGLRMYNLAYHLPDILSKETASVDAGDLTFGLFYANRSINGDSGHTPV